MFQQRSEHNESFTEVLIFDKLNEIFMFKKFPLCCESLYNSLSLTRLSVSPSMVSLKASWVNIDLNSL